MIKNYLKIAYRNLLSQKGFSGINIIGLSIGMTCCLLIFQYVAFEYSFDQFHKNKNELFRVLQAYAPKGDLIGTGQSYTSQALAPALKEAIPEIQEISRVHSDNAIVTVAGHAERVFEEDRINYVDAGFLSMFTFPLVSNESAHTLSSGQALISERAAKKYFSSENPQGQVLEITGAIKKSYTIAGVLKDVPNESHLQFDILLPVEDLLKGDDYSKEPESGWSWNNFDTYVLLQAGADKFIVERKMTDVFIKNRGDVLRQQGMTGMIQAQPITDIHLNADVEAAGNIASGSYRTVYFFVVVGIITLIIALVNYINLATARAVNRSREVGVRKVVGARRGQLMAQFLSESALTNVLAAFLAFVFASMLIPVVNDLAETHLSIDLWMSLSFWLAFCLTITTGTLLAGLYPAFVLSSFKPASVLKGRAAHIASHLWLRKGLVVIQFAASIVLLAGTAIVYNQLTFMRGMDLGLTLDKVVTFRTPRILPENSDRPAMMASAVQQIGTVPGVEKCALSSSVPGRGFNWNGAAIRKAEDDASKAIRGVATYIDSTFASLYGIELVAGQDFGDLLSASITPTTDGAKATWQVILNETAVKSLGFNTPADAIGQPLDIGGTAAQVLGVYKDFKWTSAHEAQQSIVFGVTRSGQYISMQLSATNFNEVIQKVQAMYTQQFPGNIFQYEFADQTFDVQYKDDQRFAKLFSFAAGMTIFIACLGLFGLVTFTAQQRTKEIGMRKVLGATVGSIVGLLSKDFLKLVLIGYVIAIPLTWYAMSKWLENFAYRTTISPGILAMAGVIAFVIAIVTVSWQSFKAAAANPVKSLKND